MTPKFELQRTVIYTPGPNDKPHIVSMLIKNMENEEAEFAFMKLQEFARTFESEFYQNLNTKAGAP